MIPRETIDKIFEIAKIEEVIGDFVSLKKRGVNYLGNCPFHNEKTPSFSVSPIKGIFKCFGCGKGGNIIKFIMEIEHYSYPEALKYIANKYHIEVIEEELTADQKIKKDKKDNHYLIVDFAKDFFKNTLHNNDKGKVGLSYFYERGFNTNIIELFDLGYSHSNNSIFTNNAIKNGFDKSLLIESGLGIDGNKKIIDRFNDRIMFPIHSFSGRVLGFGGRALKKTVKAKYLNSPETLIYHKSKILYGLFQAKTDIKKEDNCFIVEGYTDVISMHQKGIRNVVSASGTALSVEQLRLITRITDNITLMFDGDEAGIKATYRTIDLALKEGLEVNIIIFPEGEDPDSYAKQKNEEEFKNFLNTEKLNFVDYKIIISDLKNLTDPKSIIKIKRNIFLSIANINDALIRSEYCKTYSKKIQINEATMLQEISRIRKTISSYAPQENDTLAKGKNIEKKETKLYRFEEEIIRILINYGDEELNFNGEELSVANMILTDLKIDNINIIDPVLNKIYVEIDSCFKKKNNINLDYLINHPDDEISALIIDLISSKHTISSNWQKRHKIFTGRENEKMKKTTEKAILSLKKCHLEITIQKIQEKIRSDRNNMSLIKELNDLTKIKIDIAKILGRNIG